MTSLDAHFENLSPLLDDIVARIGSLNLCAYKTATLSAWAVARIAIGTRIVIADQQIDGEQLSADERQQLMDMTDNMRKSDAALMAAVERHVATIN